jgi:hypothetical protein
MLMNNHNVRPYWHVDLKWICGILFAVGLGVSLLLFLAATLTSKRIAVPIATEVAASMVSRNGLDDTTDIDEFKKKAAAQPGEAVETLPGIFVTKADLATLSPRELRLKIFAQVVTPYYELGAKGVAAKQTNDPQEQANIEQQVGVMGLLNQQTHDGLQRSFWISLGALVLPLIGLIRFSAGWGRLVSPGIIMAVMTFPGAVGAVIFEIAKRSSKPAGGGGSPIPNVSPESLQMIAAAVLPMYVTVFIMGATLLTIAAIGKAWTKRTHH